MALPLVILGAGPHAQVVASVAQRLGRRIHGYTDSDSALHGKVFQNAPVLGSDETLLASGNTSTEIELVVGIGAFGDVALRTKLFENFSTKGYRFATLVHPQALVAEGVEIGEGSVVMMGAVVQIGAKIGRNVILNTRSSIDHGCAIGDHCHVAPGVTLCGDVILGAGVQVGAGATIIPRVEIGRTSVIGAGAVVLKSAKPSSWLLGCPAKAALKESRQ